MFFFYYKNKCSKYEDEKVAVWQHFLISGKHRHTLFNICVLSFTNKKIHYNRAGHNFFNALSKGVRSLRQKSWNLYCTRGIRQITQKQNFPLLMLTTKIYSVLLILILQLIRILVPKTSVRVKEKWEKDDRPKSLALVWDVLPVLRIKTISYNVQ